MPAHTAQEPVTSSVVTFYAPNINQMVSGSPILAAFARDARLENQPSPDTTKTGALHSSVDATSDIKQHNNPPDQPLSC